MKKNESFREYFRRARHDPSVRRQLIANARVARSIAGWVAVILAAIALWESVSQGVQTGFWLPHGAIIAGFGFIANGFVWDKYGERIAALESMGD
jgi:hypothetical protein